MYELERLAETARANMDLAEKMGRDSRIVELWRRVAWSLEDAALQHEAIRDVQHELAEQSV